MRAAGAGLFVLMLSSLAASAALAQDAPVDAPAEAPQPAVADPHDEPIAAPVEETVEVPLVPPIEEARPGEPAMDEDPQDRQVECPSGRLLCWQNDVVAIWPRVRIRPGFEYVDADPQILYVGSNDGFFVDSARLGAEGKISDLVHFKLTIEAASLQDGAALNEPVRPLLAAARDAWVAWTPSPWFMLRVGQQTMPSDFEGGDIRPIIPFTRRSVASAGTRAGHGNAVAGLSPSWEVGVVLGSAGAKLGEIPVEYRLGVSNGNGRNQLGNDNELPAGYLRLGTGFDGLVQIGVGGRFNPRTVGSLPNLYTESDAVGFADVALTVAGLEVMLEGMYRQTSLTTLIPEGSDDAGQESAFGATSWLAYKIGLGTIMGAAVDVKPAVRVSFYEPSSAFATDQLLETTLGVRLDGDARIMPLSFLVDYTILTEVGDVGDDLATRDLANNRLTALFQLEL